MIQAYGASHSMSQLHKFIDRPFMEGGSTHSGGKGKTEAEAKTSCLCEAIERYSGGFQGTEIWKTAAFIELNQDAVFPPQCLNYSDLQYQGRDLWNAGIHKFHWIGERFDPEKKIDWSPIWSLTERRHKWIPTQFCYYGVPGDGKEAICIGDSNGCAAGNTIEEAILQGFFELVERDGIAIWWYNRLNLSGVDVESFHDPYLDRLIEYYRKKGREIWAIDLTFDLGFPTFAAISREKNREGGERILMGFGSHFDPNIALVRAFNEMGQTLGAIRALKENGPAKNPAFRSWLESATVKEHSYLLPCAKKNCKRLSDYPPFIYQTSLEAISLCSRSVEEKNMGDARPQSNKA